MTINDIKNTLSKYAKLNLNALTKDYVIPSMATGVVLGTGITAATAKSKDEFMHKFKKGVIAGVAGSAAEGAVMGLWKQRSAVKAGLANLAKAASCEKDNK